MLSAAVFGMLMLGRDRFVCFLGMVSVVGSEI